MAREQVNTNEARAKAVAEATRAAIQVMGAATTERLKINGPVMEKPYFDWEEDDKYSKLKNFGLEVNDIFRSYNTPHAKQLAIVKNR